MNIDDMKDTKNLQFRSVIAYAKELGFELVNPQGNHLQFQDQVGRKVKVQKMIDWHNGNVARVGMWASHTDRMYNITGELGIRLNLDDHAKIDEWKEKVNEAYRAKLVITCYLRWNNKAKTLYLDVPWQRYVKMANGRNFEDKEIQEHIEC